ncbi:MAG: hypothetical protein ACYT04_44115 [Nostoc sp.]
MNFLVDYNVQKYAAILLEKIANDGWLDLIPLSFIFFQDKLTLIRALLLMVEMDSGLKVWKKLLLKTCSEDMLLAVGAFSAS